MWNIETGRAITVYKGHRDSVTSMKILDAHGTQQLFTTSLDAVSLASVNNLLLTIADDSNLGRHLSRLLQSTVFRFRCVRG